MWRNPITNRFEAGDPPANQQQPETTAEGFPVRDNAAHTVATPPRGGDVSGGWTHPAESGDPFVPVAGSVSYKGDTVQSAADVLSGANTGSQRTGNDSDVPRG